MIRQEQFRRPVFGLAALAMLSGCAVGQRPGAGEMMSLTEQTTGGHYYLYLPKDYDDTVQQGGHPPLVVTLHGMKPFDTAHAQIREWQQEADRYGYVVCAPVLTAPDLLSPLPLRDVTNPVKKDERNILAIMDEVQRSTSIDPNHVLITCWSYGGYLAHYMMNRHPDRFSCLVVKQANFSEEILDPGQVPRYRDRKVGIFYTQNDFKICREESKAAAKWYHRHGFDVTFAVFQDLGHERTPSLAASFFAPTCGATPKTPPVELARLKVFELPPQEAASVAAEQVAQAARSSRPVPAPRSGDRVATAPAPSPRRSEPAAEPQGRLASNGGRNIYGRPQPAKRPLPQRAAPVETRPQPTRTRPSVTPQRLRHPGDLPPVASTSPVGVRLSSTIGISPLLVSYSVAPMPRGLKGDVYFLWTDNGEPMSNARNGQKLLTKPGTHRIEVLVATGDGREYRAHADVTVLERIASAGR